MKKILVLGLILLILFSGCQETQKKPVVPPVKGPVCGDGVCDAKENQRNCSKDCVEPLIEEYCGDGICNEDTISCEQDCEPIGPVCENGICEERENNFNCPNDCVAPFIEPLEPIPDLLSKSEVLLNNSRIRKAIEANPLIDSDEYTEVILQKINEIGEGNTSSWNDYRNACPHTLLEEERDKCLRDIYLRKVALSIYVEVNEIVPWRLLEYTDEELEILLGDLFVSAEYYKTSYQLFFNGNPMLPYNYVRELRAVYSEKEIRNQKDLLDLIIIRMRGEGWIHFRGFPDPQEICNHSSFDFKCLSEWKQGGDPMNSDFIYALLQSHNIPSLSEGVYLKKHAGLIFPSLSLTMLGNNVYGQFMRGMILKPNYLPVDLTYLDLETYNEWNQLEKCESDNLSIRKEILDYLSLYDDSEWNKDIIAVYCDNRLGKQPGKFLRSVLTNLSSEGCNGEEKQALTEQEIGEWVEKISQVSEC